MPLPLILFPTPCVNRPSSFASDCAHISVYSPFIKFLYSCSLPVSRCTTDFTSIDVNTCVDNA